MQQSQRLGRFEIRSALGAGGMGEVWRAHDPQLGRDVAIKLLPGELAHDSERLARLEREANALAAVNHPNVASIYELGEHEGRRFLVLEVVEGEALSKRLENGPLKVDEALEIAQQVAAGLEAAHASGVIHRDLKPANVMVTPDGLVKVLDFGLARATPGPESSTAESRSAETEIGTVLGTAPYMSPEQARGEPATRQADVWAFGVLLYELLSGASPFARPSRPETLAHVLVAEPDLDALPADVPSGVRRIIRRCLAKDLRRRLRDMGDVRIDIEDALGEGRQPTAAPHPTSARIWQLGIAASVAAAIGALASFAFLGSARDADNRSDSVVRLALPNLGTRHFQPYGLRATAITDDGSRIVYASDDGVWVYSLTDDNSHRIDQPGINPFVSPQGDRIGYFETAGSRLVTTPVEGGTAQTLAVSTERNIGADWGAGGTVVFAMTSGLYAVPADGRESPRLLAGPDRAADELFYAWPEISPDGNTVVFTVVPAASADSQPSLAVYELDTDRVSPLLPAAASARFVGDDRLLFVRNGALMTVAFDPESRTVSGTPTSISGVSVFVTADNAAAEYDISDNGTLIHIGSMPDPTRGNFSLYWSDRDGNEELLPVPRDVYVYPRVSPDGTRIAFERIVDGNRDIWIYDTVRQSTSRFTTGPTEDMLAVWSPDGSRIWFSSNRSGNFDIYSKPSDASTDARVELQRPIFETPMFFGRHSSELVVFEEFSNVSVVDLAEKTVTPLLNRESTDAAAGVSPDGNWLLYLSDESGPGWEVYLRRFDRPMEQRIQVSTDGGTFPMWGPPGSNELYYVSLDGEFMAVPVEFEPELRVGTPVKLFDTMRPQRNLAGRPYDISPIDGRFLLTRFHPDQNQQPGQGSVSVILNWRSELEAQLGAQ